MISLETLGSNVRAERNRLGISQEELAKMVGSCKQSVYNWETGRSSMSVSVASSLADIFGTSVDELVGYGKRDD